MPKPTRYQVVQHNAFLRRQQIHERKYQKQFYRYLASVNYAVAKAIDDNGLNISVDNYLDYDKVEAIYKRLYKDVTISEASIQWKDFDFNKEIKNKDLIDDLVGILSSGESEPISLWRNLLSDFITVRIAGRITEVNSTTRKRIAKLIEQGIAEGLGAEEVARNIRKDRGYNRNRSLAIARTETVTAANQGKFMAALSSPYVQEKKWLPTNDARTRISHLGMLDTPYIDLDLSFHIANASGDLEPALYPCASTMSASNVVNCRCSLVFRNKRNSNGRLIRKSMVKSKDVRKEYVTAIKAIDPKDGKLKDWRGDRIKAK